MIVHTLGVLAIALYLLGGASSFRRRREIEPSEGVTLLFTVLGFVNHSLVLVVLVIEQRLLPIGSTSSYLFWLSWGLVLGLFLFRTVRFPVAHSLGLSSVAILLIASSYLAHSVGGVKSGMDFESHALHILPSLLALAGMITALLISLTFLAQNLLLKRRDQAIWSFNGPSLAVLESSRGISLAIALGANTIVLITGASWMFGGSEINLATDRLVWLSGIAWIVLGSLCLLRQFRGISPRQQATMTVILLGGYLTVALVGTVGFGWDVFHG